MKKPIEIKSCFVKDDHHLEPLICGDIAHVQIDIPRQNKSIFADGYTDHFDIDCDDKDVALEVLMLAQIRKACDYAMQSLYQEYMDAYEKETARE